MGIKGIYKELGPGKRVSLSKLTADSFESLGRPLRVAIDIAIWQFQTQAARGGTNPAIRTLFYRLTRLLSTPIQPIFVFDGPHKPAIKRNKRSGRGDGVATAQAKRLIRLFGFAVHDAPGEAEAECALLQQHGIVDAVLSEDVDTIMFGCTKTLRNWSAEGKSAKTPTHVTMYDVNDIKQAGLGLDREGMVLVALMSGGDYLPDGIPGCGVKVACEAAKAGFGKSICRLKTSDAARIQAWRSSLAHELHSNEKGYFRVRHKALRIPQDFPNMEVLRYYTHPVVSKTTDMESIRQKFEKRRDMELDGLREFTRETFDWDYRIGAIKFIRVLGQALLVRHMLMNQAEGDKHVERITGRRKHFSTDATSELRVSYIPGDVVPIDLSAEVDEVISSGREGLALNSDDDFEAPEEGVDAATKTGTGKVFDVSKPDLAWVLEDLARRSAPQAVSAWEEVEAAKALRKSPKKKTTTTSTRVKKAINPQKGAMEQYVRTTKSSQPALSTTKPPLPLPASPPKPSSPRRRDAPIQRPQTPPPPPSQDSSKPSTPSTTNSLVRFTADWAISSSHDASPRTPSQRPGRPPAQHHPETIVLSSSPAELESSPRLGTRAGASGQGSGEVAESVRKILAEGCARGEMRNAVMERTGSRKKAAEMVKTTYKQTSMDVFTTRRTQTLTSQATPQATQTRPTPEDLITIDSSPLSPPRLPPPISPSKRSSHTQSPTLRATSPSPTRPQHPQRKKKLLVPRASDAGFFETIDVEAEEVDEVLDAQTRRLKARGVKTDVVRWSDVSQIDLTGEDDGWTF
ncbi:XPG i-region domain-containing protein [Sarocladium implicatum]|nr:XPG i-region domain-containing protein [Sarocladium implicatum]